jgi:sulfide:quinone oxidoreductase
VTPDPEERMRVVIAGGGVAALETLLALRALADHRVELTVLSPERELLYRPATVAEAFGRGEAHSYDLSEIVDDQGARTVEGSLMEVDADQGVAVTAGGERVGFDRLVVATGAIAREPLAGALTFRGRGDVPALRSLLNELVGGQIRSVVFAAPSARMWTLPIYELALMTAAHLREHGADAAEVSLVTPEEEPLELLSRSCGDRGALPRHVPGAAGDRPDQLSTFGSVADPACYRRAVTGRSLACR